MPQTYKLALLDDYQKVAMRMADWDRLRKRGVEITVFHDACTTARTPPEAGAVRHDGPAARAYGVSALADREAGEPQVHGADRRAAHPRRQRRDRARHPDRPLRPPARTRRRPNWAGPADACARHLAARAADARRPVAEAIEQTEVLDGKRLGMLGLGKLGNRVAHYAKAFGMDVVAWSQNLTAERAAEGGGAREQGRAAADPDFVSIHLVLSERTRGLIPGATSP